MVKLHELGQILRHAGAGFLQHRIVKLSASLSYFTIFTLGPMMLVIIYISSLFWGRRAIEGTIHNQISGLIGDGAATQIQELIKNASITSNSFLAVIGIVALIFAATTVFTQIQDTMNTIWNLKVKSGRGWQQMLKNRLLSFAIVTGLSLMLLISLVLNGLLEGFMSKLKDLFPQIAFVVVYLLNLSITLLVVASLFAFIYKVLPDAHLQWKDVAAGALFASVLFMIGKFCITFYINTSDIGSTYGSAGSLVILLLWIFYSANILYFGAEVSKAYALKYGAEIKPRDYAVTIRVVELESNKSSVQQNEADTDTNKNENLSENGEEIIKMKNHTEMAK